MSCFVYSGNAAANISCKLNFLFAQGIITPHLTSLRLRSFLFTKSLAEYVFSESLTIEDDGYRFILSKRITIF